MKNIKQVLLFSTLITAGSCGKNFGDINVDPNNPVIVPAEFLLTHAEKSTADGNRWLIGQILAQQWARNNFTETSRYGFGSPPWDYDYSVPMRDLAEIITLVSAGENAASAKSKNQLAIARILLAYNFHILTDLWGPVPYSDALKGDQNRTPGYDAQRDIYLSLLQELKDAILLIDEDESSFGSADVIYGGDMTQWNKFAHSLILRIAMRMSDVEPDVAREAVRAAQDSGFSSNSDNAAFHYLSGPPNNSPINENRNRLGDGYNGISNILIDSTLKPLSDPRLPFFVDERVDGGGYFGRPYGQSNANAVSESPDLYSQPSGADEIRNGTNNFSSTDVLRPEAPNILMCYAEVCFILAEAKERGWDVPGSAAEWYNAGILASMDQWGVDAIASADYLTQPDVAYATAPGDWKQKIGVQKWLALYMQGIQAWIEWRRLDFDKFELPVDGVLADVGDKVAPVRFTYPLSEQSLNRVGYEEGLSHLGGPDELFTRVWWDIH